jgi:hypothetical protein
MRHVIASTAVLIILLVVPQTTQADVTYTIQNYPADQNGHTVSGTITTDGHIGPLTEADITSWTVTFDNTFTFRSTDAGAATGVLGDVQATSTSITLGASLVTNSLTLGLSPNPPMLVTFILWDRPVPVPPGLYQAVQNNHVPFSLLWNEVTQTLGGHDPWVIAVAQGGAVPEPASLCMAGIAITAGLAYGWSRHRREQRRKAAA